MVMCQFKYEKGSVGPIVLLRTCAVMMVLPTKLPSFTVAMIPRL